MGALFAENDRNGSMTVPTMPVGLPNSTAAGLPG
jgi:hypothetical protein